MAATKNISMESYQWGHFAAIIVDFIVFIVIAYLAFRIKQKISTSAGFKDDTKKKYIKLRLDIIFWLSLIVGIVTMFGLIPVFKDYDQIIIS